MNDWEKKIADAFISRYSVSGSRAEVTGEVCKNSMRLRSVSIFPDFDLADPDEKESYLEAAESLERKGLVSLSWEKRGKGERLKTIACVNMEKLFEASGVMEPRRKAESIRLLFRKKLMSLDRETVPAGGVTAEKTIAFLEYLAEQFSSREVKWDMDLKAAEDFASLLDVFLSPGNSGNMTTRALSVSLYNDSKRMETILDLFGPALSQAQKQGVPLPDFSFLERSFPEALVSGRISLEYPNGDLPPLVNAAGLILGLPSESVGAIRSVRTITGGKAPTVLTVENKETFYALGDPLNYGSDGDIQYDCFLYTGGYPNKAAAALIRILAASGFRFFHAGDLDPDGILILQNIMDIAERPVSPFRMDASTFDRYLPLSRPLNKIMLRQILKIRQDTEAIPELSALIRRREETGRGVEQEIIDYRQGKRV
ncbi:MAG: DUF2399 domain-containing protein [Treponema sp.]|jgi:hypothetical protein|nr:DUF2399 domain-containing protein [Treponema sp.]